MIKVRGYWYPGNTSKQQAAQLEVYANGETIINSMPDQQRLCHCNFRDINISPRLADTARSLRFPGGELFATRDNDSVDELLDILKPSPWQKLLYKLETYKRYILLSLVLLFAFGWWSFQYGVPLSAKIIANALPAPVYKQTENRVLKLLENNLLKPSQLSASRKEQLKKHFQPVLKDHPDYKLQILFRHGGRLGANAFALPAGTIIFTDQMVKTSQNDNELTAILTHEIGHIVHRHGMRQVVQNSLLSFALLAITGDAAGTSEIFLTLPVILTQLSYSRDFEHQADQYALNYMQEHDISPNHFANILRRIDKEYNKRDKHEQKLKWKHYLSTHPLTKERLKPFESSQR